MCALRWDEMCIKAQNGTLPLSLEVSPSPGCRIVEQHGKLCASAAQTAAEWTSGNPILLGA